MPSPRTGHPCQCKPGLDRDNCIFCEGSGWEIDFKKIRQERRRSPRRYEDRNAPEEPGGPMTPEKQEEAFAAASILLERAAEILRGEHWTTPEVNVAAALTQDALRRILLSQGIVLTVTTRAAVDRCPTCQSTEPGRFPFVSYPDLEPGKAVPCRDDWHHPQGQEETGESPWREG